MTDQQTHTIYLPVIINTAPPAFGVQIDGPLTIPVVQDRIYHTSVRWMEPGWWIPDTVSAVDPNPLVIGTKTTPEPYRLYPDRMGSEPKPEHYQDYVDFVVGLVDRYHPYAVEVWNEPDCPTYSVPADNQYWYGAWVTDEDYYASGQRYGNLLSMVYQVLQPLGVQVLGGALQNGHVVQGREFLRGMLETGQCDYVSFHVYPYIDQDYKRVVYDAIDSIMSVAGDKPLFVTETALLTRGNTEDLDTPEFQIAQAEYLCWMKNYMAWGGVPWLWYAGDNTWQNCGLKRRDELMPVWDVWSA